MSGIRKASMTDVHAIHALLSSFAEDGLLLPRSLSDIYDHLRDYTVHVDGSGTVQAVAALHISWENLAELRSLATGREFQGRGIGRKLVEQCISEAVTLGIYRIFTLTYQVDFFRHMGFEIVDKSVLPHKIWADCIHCPKFPDCDESAMLLEL